MKFFLKQSSLSEISDNESNPPETSEIFSDGDFDDTEFADHCIPKTDNAYALIPTDIKVEDDADMAEILANPNVNTILPPLNDDRQNDILLTSPTVGAITPYHTDEEDLEDP